MAIRFSQLTAAASVSVNDLFAVSVSLGGGLYNSQKATAAQLLTYVQTSFGAGVQTALGIAVGTTGSFAPITSPSFITDITTPQINGASGGTGITVVTNNTAATALARGVYFTPTLVAAANNDVLVAIDLTSVYTDRAFTGVRHVGLRSTEATCKFELGGVITVPSYIGLYLNVTPNSTNYAIINDGSGSTFVNGVSSVYISNNGTNLVRFVSSQMQMQDAVDISFNATTGTKIGLATTQKFAFWNKTPIVQPTTAITGATLVSNAGTAITSTDTFGGYTLQKIAAALVNVGILA